MSLDSLNFAGQFILTGTASFVTNALTHPFSTIQTCRQANIPIPWITTYHELSLLRIRRQFNPPLRVPFVELFRGFKAIYAVESLTFLIAFAIKQEFKDYFGPHGAAIAATVVSTPFVAIGEGAMQNRQANTLSYRDRELWRRALRINGMVATFKRELFWNLGLFYATPKMEERLQQKLPDLNPLAGQTIVALLIGSIIGFMTTPIAGIKTQIYTSQENLSILRACRKILHLQTPEIKGPLQRAVVSLQKLWKSQNHDRHLGLARSVERLFSGAAWRVVNISAAMWITSMAYQRLPDCLPVIFFKKPGPI